jgi:hypothetical protein
VTCMSHHKVQVSCHILIRHCSAIYDFLSDTPQRLARHTDLENTRRFILDLIFCVNSGRNGFIQQVGHQLSLRLLVNRAIKSAILELSLCRNLGHNPSHHFYNSRLSLWKMPSWSLFVSWSTCLTSLLFAASIHPVNS